MSIYKYQIIKYLESINFHNIKELKSAPKENLMKYIENVDESVLSKYLNQRKMRVNKKKFTGGIIDAPFRVKIEWYNVFVEL
jgi:hypothetical protein